MTAERPVRRIFVGDIHGCREPLERLLERVRFDPAADRLYPVGDLVGRGPDPRGTLQLLRSLGACPVLGNHDLRLIQCHTRARAARGDHTLQAVLEAPDADELCTWLAAQPFLRVLPDIYLVHAGLHPAWRDPAAALAASDARAPDAAALFATRVRHCDPEGRQPAADDPPPGPPFAPWFDHYVPSRHGGRTVVFGHWAAKGLVRRPSLRGLDTGCVWGNQLTAWIAEEDRLVQVPAARPPLRL